MKLNRSVRFLSALTGVMLLLFFFQNCGPAKVSGDAVQSSTEAPQQQVDVTAMPSPTPNPTPTLSPMLVAERDAPIKTITNYCFDIESGISTNGALLNLWGCSGALHQKFRIQRFPQVDKGYIIIPLHSGLCLDVSGAGTADGTPVHQWACAVAVNQVWKFLDNGDGTFKLQDENSKKCLTYPKVFSMTTSQNLKIYSCAVDRTNQNFYF